MLIEKERKQVEKTQKSGKCNIVFVCHDTNSNKELCRSQQLNVETKLRHNSRAKEKLCRDKEFFCRDIIEKDFEENCRDNPLLCRDNDQSKQQRSCVTTRFPLSQHKRLKINI